MAGHSDVVDRADSLMRRRRSFVATPAGQADAPSGKTPAAEDDTLPVLTEVICAEAAIAGGRNDRLDERQVSLLASEIALAIGEQLNQELPTLLEAALLNAGEELRAGIAASMETALRDFLARRKQLRLPLDEPGQPEE